MTVSLRGGGLLFALLASSACFADKGPDGPPGLSATGSTSTTDASAGPTTTITTSGAAITTGVELTSSSDVTTVTGTASGPGTTDPSMCAGPGEPCGAGCCGCLACNPEKKLCAPSDAKCGTCELCDLAGACAPAPASTPCSVSDASCTATVWGEMAGTCFAYAGALGTCDGDGQCAASSCDGQGEPIVSCKSAACVRETGCEKDSPAADVSFDAFCATDDTTPSCQPTCSNEAFDSSVELLGCDAEGDCVKADEQKCGGYKCTYDPPACLKTCADAGDCITGLTCVWGMCTAD